MDGVAGVTQDAVLPGERFTYRFRAKQLGTFWYHTHQGSVDEVRRGLFGAFVIEPRTPPSRNTLDLTLIAHDFDGVPTLAGNDGVTRRRAAAGTAVRLRLVNSDNTPQQFALDGTSFRVAAIDGTELNEPTPLEHVSLKLAAGGRYDVTFTMPPTAVRLAIRDTHAALLLSADGTGDVAAVPTGAEFDPANYGRPARTTLGSSSRFDRRFRFVIGRKPGFFDGRPGLQWTINGHIYPDMPVFVVQRGELVKVEIVNNTSAVHPMHLHGHHMLVLSRNGRAVSGSPWWSDTLEVEPHQRYEVAFRADNPGIWMDHCHNLKHAAAGLTMHLAYVGVATPFLIGGPVHNHPE
jgi:FtsP/CotA-like multicopper oxidase with cupredoxin domain